MYPGLPPSSWDDLTAVKVSLPAKGSVSMTRALHTRRFIFNGSMTATEGTLLLFISYITLLPVLPYRIQAYLP